MQIDLLYLEPSVYLPTWERSKCHFQRIFESTNISFSRLVGYSFVFFLLGAPKKNTLSSDQLTLVIRWNTTHFLSRDDFISHEYHEFRIRNLNRPQYFMGFMIRQGFERLERCVAKVPVVSVVCGILGPGGAKPRHPHPLQMKMLEPKNHQKLKSGTSSEKFHHHSWVQHVNFLGHVILWASIKSIKRYS